MPPAQDAPPPTEDHELSRDAFADDKEYQLHRLRHSAAHLLAQAVMELHPDARLAIGPPVKDGFYYDIAYGRPFTPDDLTAIEARMQEIVKRDLKIVRGELPRAEAERFFAERNQPFKVELVRGFPEGEPIGTYTQGDFVDLCRGPHVDRTGKLKHTRLMSVAGAYWRGDAKNEQLQRIYGTAWPTAAELAAHLERLEQAKARDHRRLGRELKLFMFHEWAPGTPFWMPRGLVIWNLLSTKMRETLLSEGYVEVRAPLLWDKALWETSGHWEHYREDMFHVDSEGRTFSLKPMNCPAHMLFFKNEKRSYRELPLRVHDQGVLHRNELSGALSGLTRVRQFSQDDAHLFVTPDQIGGEIDRMLGLMKRVYGKLGLGVDVKLSTRPEKFLGTVETWDQAEKTLGEAIERNGFTLRIKPGEGTFYGPKIDFDITDAIGRQFQCATVQLDYQIPQRFDLSYVGADNAEHRPVVIHRAIYGSFERFIGILIEHFAGAFPFWLAPVQLRVLSVGSDFAEYGAEVVTALRARGLRVESDFSDSTVGAKVREAQVEKVPYSLMLGGRERDGRSVTLRAYGQKEQVSLSLDDAIARFTAENTFSF